MPDTPPAAHGPEAIPVRIRDVVKDYQSLRPLRIRELDIDKGQGLALLGFDEVMAAVFVDLLTAGALPDSGEVVVFGRPTGAVTDHREWMTMLDHFGLVSARSVLLPQLTAEQNLAIPLTDTVISMPPEIRSAVRRLADEIAIPPSHLTSPTGDLPPASLLRVRLGRALALDPKVVLAEHPNASVSSEEARAFAADIKRIRASRGIATVVLTADPRFAAEVADTVLTLQPATGDLKVTGKWSRWFG